MRPAGLWISTVSVGYGGDDPATATAAMTGGATLELDLSSVVAGHTTAHALAAACAAHWGTPARARSTTWFDPAFGSQTDLEPAFWADWSVGDRINDGTSLWKLHTLSPDPEGRSAAVELSYLEAAL